MKTSKLTKACRLSIQKERRVSVHGATSAAAFISGGPSNSEVEGYEGQI